MLNDLIEEIFILSHYLLFWDLFNHHIILLIFDKARQNLVVKLRTGLF